MRRATEEFQRPGIELRSQQWARTRFLNQFGCLSQRRQRNNNDWGLNAMGRPCFNAPNSCYFGPSPYGACCCPDAVRQGRYPAQRGAGVTMFTVVADASARAEYLDMAKAFLEKKHALLEKKLRALQRQAARRCAWRRHLPPGFGGRPVRIKRRSTARTPGCHV